MSNLASYSKLSEVSDDNALQLAANINLINMILLGLTEVMQDRATELKHIGDAEYYQVDSEVKELA